MRMLGGCHEGRYIGSDTISEDGHTTGLKDAREPQAIVGLQMTKSATRDSDACKRSVRARLSREWS